MIYLNSSSFSPRRSLHNRRRLCDDSDASRTNRRARWLEAEDLLNVFAISESTPGPFAVNTATFVGYDLGGVLGSAVATIGVVLPSFIIILIIARFIYNFLEYKSIRTGFETVKVIVVGLIFAVVLELILKNVFGDGFDLNSFDFVAFGIMVSVFFLKLVFKKLSAIKIIIISGILGLIFYGIFPL